MENARNIKRYEDYLKNEEKADATIRKYLHEVEQLLAYMDKAEISKAAILQYRRYLSSQYKAGTVNGKLSAIHSYLEFMNLDMCKVKFLKVQKKAYIDEERELAEQYKIETIPSLMLVKDGQCSELLVNPPSKAAVKTWLQEKGVL